MRSRLAGIAAGVLAILVAGCGKTTNLPPISSVPSDLQPFVSGLLDKKNSDMRWQAARELGLRGADSAPAIPYLVAALKDEEEKVRLFAVLALGEIGPLARKAIPELEEMVETERDGELRRATVRALAQIKGTFR
jgi:HEAT repeat protein